MRNNKAIIGRKKEIEKLDRIVQSKKSEFFAVYGRRRIGKTFLIREYFNYTFDFQIAGLANATTQQQLFNFDTALRKQSNLVFEEASENWLIAFQRLIEHLENKRTQDKIVLFFDELSWFDTPASDFVMGLEHFWNSWAATRDDILLVVCGSAASWIINKLINHKGGLHNRVTERIKLEPFSLKEAEELLKQKKNAYER